MWHDVGHACHKRGSREDETAGGEGMQSVWRGTQGVKTVVRKQCPCTLGVLGWPQAVLEDRQGWLSPNSNQVSGIGSPQSEAGVPLVTVRQPEQATHRVRRSQ